MTKDVIELAREAGFGMQMALLDDPFAQSHAQRLYQQLAKFAALVAARERERLTSAAMESASKAIDAAVSMTIERCAQLCEAMHEEDRPGDYAYAIRALNTEGDGHG